MEKKMFYQIDNSDVNQIVEADLVMDVIKGEAESYTEKTNKDDEPSWTITLVWMTQEEYENLPDAY